MVLYHEYNVLSTDYNGMVGSVILEETYMSESAFANLLKKLRVATGLTLREFCQRNGIDPGNYSRLERGRFLAPESPDILERYAVALGLRRGTDDWLEFFDAAAASRGKIPQDLLSDDKLVEKLPVLFRTLRGHRLDEEKLDALAEKIRRS
jgi:transcriptional regulator with XRE-family HTH domain